MCVSVGEHVCAGVRMFVSMCKRVCERVCMRVSMCVCACSHLQERVVGKQLRNDRVAAETHPGGTCAM